MCRPFLIGICGGSASGKTTIANCLADALPKSMAVVFSLDNYYHDLSNFPKDISGNYDHPDSLDQPLLISHLQNLKNGKTIQAPLYDFNTHTRKSFVELDPPPVVIVEGLLLYSIKELIPLLDLKIFIETSMDLMLVRRLMRDINERGRSVNSVIDQFLATVRPMYFEFVKKHKDKADIVLSGDIAPEECFNQLKQSLKSINVPALSALQ